MIRARYLGNSSLAVDALATLRAHLTQREHALVVKLAETRTRLARRLWQRRKSQRGYLRRQSELLSKDMLEQAGKEATRGYREGLLAAKTDSIRLALQIAEEIIKTKIKEPEFVVSRIESCIDALLSTQGLRIIVSQDSTEEVRSKLSRLYPQAEIVSSSTLSAGNAILTTPRGEVQLAWENHLQLIRETILDANRDA